jgi:hypothetical protein
MKNIVLSLSLLVTLTSLYATKELFLHRSPLGPNIRIFDHGEGVASVHCPDTVFYFMDKAWIQHRYTDNGPIEIAPSAEECCCLDGLYRLCKVSGVQPGHT